ncbi:MAG: HAMP domain-containing protein [Myxococcaceae bacterium]|nr:HAMP domain-containing protein [Myxococcaceae bacterium]
MRLAQKLILFVLAASVVPLSFVGAGLLRRLEQELSERLAAEQRAVADAAIESASAELNTAIGSVERAALLVDWSNANAEEATGALKLVYASSPLVSGVLLYDPARTAPVPPVSGAEGHPPFSAHGEAALRGFPFSVLSTRGAKGQVAAAAAYAGTSAAALPVAIQVGPSGPNAPFVTAELSFAPLVERLKARAAQGPFILILYDAEGRVLASSDGRAPLSELGAEVKTLVATDALFGKSTKKDHLAWAKGNNAVGVNALVTVSQDVVMAPVRALRRNVLTILGLMLIALVIAATLFVRGIGQRLSAVSEAADAYGRGDLSKRVTISGADELADFAQVFNRMGVELEAARARLTTWNDELKKRVDEALADLKAAQAQLLEAQKLAAIGQLGAGVAHEINNPLCGILGNAQLLMMMHENDGDFKILQKIEESAKRCRDITQNLLRFSQSTGRFESRPCDLNAVVRGVLRFEQPRHDEANVKVEVALSEGPLTIVGDPDQLSQLFSALFSNARTAMLKRENPTLTVRSHVINGSAIVDIEDNGKGISPVHLPRIFEPFFTTKDVWSNIGLGLSVAYRIVTEHQGRIEAASEEGKGACFKVTLPLHTGLVKASSAASIPVQPLVVGGQGVGIVK